MPREWWQTEKLPWAPAFRWWKRCRAYKDDKQGTGQCDLMRGHKEDHAMDRGMDIPRWSTEWTR